MKRPLRSEQFLLNLLGQKISIFPIAGKRYKTHRNEKKCML